MSADKKQYLYILLIVLVFSLIFVCRVSLYSYYLSFKNGDQVAMHNAIIPIRKGFDISLKENSLTMANPIEDKYMVYFHWPISRPLEQLGDVENVFIKSGTTIVSSREEIINNTKYFVVTYIDKSKRTTISMYSPKNNVRIEYIGPGKFYKEFIGLIRDIEFTRQ